MARFLKGAAVLLTAICVLCSLLAGSFWLFSAADEREPSDLSDTSVCSDISDRSDVSDRSDEASGEPLLGDVNGDNGIDMKDVLSLRRYIAHIGDAIHLPLADVYTDNSVDMKDVLLLRQYIAHLEVHFGAPDVSSETADESAAVSDESDGSAAETPIATTTMTTTTAPAETDTEMRAVWVAYYEVADLMKSSVSATKTALDKLMDNCVAFGANTVMFHVRAYSDAYYDSDVFPLHSSVKKLIADGFDPLTYAVSAAHQRGLELHAWVNPYRIGTSTANACCDDYFSFNNRYYYNPASATARGLVLNGIRELVTGYDVDGIHFDDYFYPEGISESKQTFDTGYTSGNVGDFRRKQVSLLISEAYSLIHSLKEEAVFGISPAANLDNNYNRLYADVKTWLAKSGYVDYLCPQIYFGFKNAASPFETCVSTWASFPRATGVKLYVGLAVYKAGLREDTWAGTNGKTEWLNGGDILAKQVKSLRKRTDVDGFMLFSYSYLTQTAVDSTVNNPTVVAAEVNALIKEMCA